MHRDDSEDPTVISEATPAPLDRAETAHFYNDKVVDQFAVATVFWGIVGMAVGVFIAAQLYLPALNFDTP